MGRVPINGRRIVGVLLLAALPLLSACGTANLAAGAAAAQGQAQPTARVEPSAARSATAPVATPTALPTAVPTVAPTATPAQAQPTAQAGLSEDALKNASYELPDLGVVHLQNGKYELKLGPGATQVNTAGYQTAAFGDLDGDGVKDAAVVLWSSTGGSGTFIYLVAVKNQNGAPRQVAVVRLGDREKIGALSIADGKIRIEMTTFGPKDPKCCPSQQVTKTYELAGAALKPLP